MKCPFCNNEETKVVDKRGTEEAEENRRRRECVKCEKRFTTYEKVDVNKGKIEKIKKREGQISNFDQKRITEAIFKAVKAVGGTDRKRAEQLSNEVAKILNKRFLAKEGKVESMPTVEDVQDIVEKVLIENGHAKTAKAYILYRQQRAELRKEKTRILEKETLDEVDKNFDLNALRVLKSRYLRKDNEGKLIESPKQLFTRVAIHGALPDALYDHKIYDINSKQAEHPKEDFDPEANHEYSIAGYKLNQYHLDALKRMYDRFNSNKQMKITWSDLLSKLKKGDLDLYEENIIEYYDVMTNKKFMPNTPAIANFGSVLGMGSACFVLGIKDSIVDIMEKVKQASIIFKSGGGLGYNFSHLRPEGDFVSTTCGLASGPLSFMSMFDKMTEVIKQGGIRRGANMGIMNSNHPDIESFITAKAGNKAFRNFNISVNMLPEFWECYENNKPYPLVNPRDGKVVKNVDPKALFDKIIYQAWESAEPGIIFSDKANEYNPLLESLGPIETTNPCVTGESLIPTENGLEKIDSINAENIFVDTRTIENPDDGITTIQSGTQVVKPTQIVKTGIKEVFKLITNSGYELEATPDHKIMTENGWMPISELTVEDSIFIQSGEGVFRDDVKLPFNIENKIKGENGRIYTFNFPTEWNFDLGLTLGWLVGDGFINKKHNTVGFVFAPQDSEAKDKIKPILENYFNREIKPSEYENGCMQLRSNSKEVTNFFLNMGYNPEEREVPKTIFTASREAVLGFLSGLFSADGTINLGSKSRNYIRLNSSSLKLLKQVQLILLNLGVRTSIYDRSTKPKIFTYKTKDGEIKEYQTSGINYELNVSKKNLEKFIELINFSQTRNKEKIELLKEFEFYQETFTDKIYSIENIGEKEVWDITEPQTHSFIANGIVVHNCGEVLLYPNESCNLGSINVWAFVKEDEDGNMNLDWEDLAKTARIGARFLDNVVEVNKWPLQDIEDMALNTRKTGLGVMGVGDLLYELNLPYNKQEGRDFMEKLMEFINYYSKIESIELAKIRGSFLYYDKSFYKEGRLPFAGFYDKKSWNMNWNKISEDVKTHGLRNAFSIVIAPTGSISMIAGCSSGIEPVYSLVFEKNVKVGSFYYVEPVFEKKMRIAGLFDEQLVEDVNANKGTVQNIGYIPTKEKEVFVTAMDTTPENHIRALASFQKWVDSSISKTNNFPADATVEHMRESYILAKKLGCKGLTVYRDSSIKEQVLVSGVKKSDKHKADTGLKPKLGQPLKEEVRLADEGQQKPLASKEEDQVAVAANEGTITTSELAAGDKPDSCPACETPTRMEEGCVSCPSCGWGKCA